MNILETIWLCQWEVISMTDVLYIQIICIKYSDILTTKFPCWHKSHMNKFPKQQLSLINFKQSNKKIKGFPTFLYYMLSFKKNTKSLIFFQYRWHMLIQVHYPRSIRNQSYMIFLCVWQSKLAKRIALQTWGVDTFCQTQDCAVILF